MRIWAPVVAILLGVSAFAAAQAQSGGERQLMDAGAGAIEAQKQAAAASAHPGDELMTCEQLEAELATSMDSSAMHDSTAAIQATAQSEKERGRRMQKQAAANIAANAALGVAGSFVPGVGYAQGALMQRQMQAQQKEGEAGQRATAGMIGNMSDMMPALMRGQRLMELGQARNCPFTKDMPAR